MRYFKRLILALLVVSSVWLVSAKANATETSIYLYSVSKHLIKGEFNETNEMLAIQYGEFSIGAYNNSFEDNSYFLGYKKKVTKNLHYGLMLATGYKYDVTPIPLVGGTVDLFPVGSSMAQVEVNAIPAAFTVSFKLTFDYDF